MFFLSIMCFYDASESKYESDIFHYLTTKVFQSVSAYITVVLRPNVTGCLFYGLLTISSIIFFASITTGVLESKSNIKNALPPQVHFSEVGVPCQ